MDEKTKPKLVRNLIPQIISNNGQGEVLIIRKITGHLLQVYFYGKYVEEGSEIWNANTREKKLAEFADTAQVLRDWSLSNDITPEEVEVYRVRKEKERGGFSQGIILDSVQKGP